MINFASDNVCEVHPNILKSISDCNFNLAKPYGYDIYTNKLRDKFCEVFDRDVALMPVFNGTGANCVILDILTNRNSMILSAKSSHISEDECGAPTRHLGCPIRFVNDNAKKVLPSDLSPFLSRRGSEHKSCPDVLSISQLTERGEAYSLDEIKGIGDYCKENGYKIHVDGSRISNAAAISDNPIKAVQCVIDNCDGLAFGGTKNGLMGAELVIVHKSNEERLKYAVKQGIQLPSKARYLSAQFLAYFENNLWLSLARNANSMTKKMYEGLKDSVDFIVKPDGNISFIVLPEKAIKALHNKYYFYAMESLADNKQLCRIITSWNTKAEDVDLFVKDVLDNI